jgi:hypothetical protein
MLQRVVVFTHQPPPVYSYQSITTSPIPSSGEPTKGQSSSVVTYINPPEVRTATNRTRHCHHWAVTHLRHHQRTRLLVDLGVQKDKRYSSARARARGGKERKGRGAAGRNHSAAKLPSPPARHCPRFPKPAGPARSLAVRAFGTACRRTTTAAFVAH